MGSSLLISEDYFSEEIDKEKEKKQRGRKDG